jgi:DNA-binding response OmpR family regulator
MRVLLADHNPEMLETTARALAGSFVIDLATTKTRCIDLLRPGSYDVLIACEQLEDGSGLELLSRAERRWPTVLRVFAADPQRLHLLKGRLAPFKLYRALPYPIDAEHLGRLLKSAEKRTEQQPPSARPTTRRSSGERGSSARSSSERAASDRSPSTRSSSKSRGR